MYHGIPIGCILHIELQDNSQIFDGLSRYYNIAIHIIIPIRVGTAQVQNIALTNIKAK